MTTAHGILFQDDCLNVLPNIASNSIDCVFADPPFNIGKDYKNGYNDVREKKEYLKWCEKWIKECCRVLKKGGSFFLYATPELNIEFGKMLSKKLQFRHWIAISMKGTFKRGNRLYPAHYGLLYYTKGEPNVFNNLRTPIPLCRHCGGEIPDYGGHRNKMNPDGVNLTDIWTDTSPNRHAKFKVRGGVNELKLLIPERAILISTNPGQIVLDPFGGGGSTFQAAEKNHRNWIGIELYDCNHIKKRLSENFPNSVGKPTFDFNNIIHFDK
ncbi:MAG: site-specific DNA-methyltransferase [Flavipsychrobacter sp.]|nr:site-specific DNA-methyltransferase [Flavipsychrobacter sp.]